MSISKSAQRRGRVEHMGWKEFRRRENFKRGMGIAQRSSLELERVDILLGKGATVELDVTTRRFVSLRGLRANLLDQLQKLGFWSKEPATV